MLFKLKKKISFRTFVSAKFIFAFEKKKNSADAIVGASGLASFITMDKQLLYNKGC